MDNAQKLQKAGYKSLLQLAIHAPLSYIDTTLSNSITIGEIHTIEAEVISSYKQPKTLKVLVRTPLCAEPIELTIFHPKPYHNALFKPHMNCYLQGKIERFNTKLQMVNPKKISHINEIIPKYKTTLRQDVYRNIVKSLIDTDMLVKEGLDIDRAGLIARAHKPDAIWLKHYKKHQGLGDKSIEAFKFAEALDHFRRFGKRKAAFKAMQKLHGSTDLFVKKLPFALTDAQKDAINEIRVALSGEKAARRMIVGDVGSGKTMIILAAAMIAYPDRSILMAPTSILARQLYEEAKKWLPKCLSVALVTQSKEEGEIEKAHLIVGTHALLYRDLPPAPLVMVDEQHRFGTKQRKLLEHLMTKNGDTARPHYLQFSATPIPRTQAMMDSALVDVTLIDSLPFAKDITTLVIGKEDFASLLEHIKKEIKQEHQVLIVYPLVQMSEYIDYRSLEESEAFWQERFDGVYVTHGKDKDKEEKLERFAKDGNILLATTVIEVGISLPKLSTIIIVGAERMGLATLHQLRGRVSRNGLKGYCYLFTHDLKNPRLKAFAKTTNGFDIAKLDLKFRESGDLLSGKMQSGKSFLWLDMAEDEDIVSEAKKAASLSNVMRYNKQSSL